MTKARGVLRTYPAGAPATGLAISIKREVDDVEIATDTTDASGVWDFSQNGSSGPWYWGGTDTAPTPDAVRVGSTDAYGGGGAYSLYELVYALRALGGGTVGNGIIDGFLNELAPTYDAAGLDLDVATGGAVIKGIPCIFSAVSDHAVTSTRDATNTRACYLVLRVTGAGETEEGKSVLADTCGAAAASPALPALTQTEALYEYPLATFILPTTASTTLTSVVDVRTFLGTRNPVVSSVVRRTDPTSATATNSTTGEDVAGLATTVTLLSGVVYDLTASAVVLIKAAAGQTVSIAPYLTSPSEIAAYIATNVSADYLALGNAHTKIGVTGSGSAVDCGVYWKVSGGTGSAITGVLLVTAIPRS